MCPAFDVFTSVIADNPRGDVLQENFLSHGLRFGFIILNACASCVFQ